MRLWSIHPRHLDCKGLVAVWREGLLARKVLSGETRGYRNHPQLDRFRACSNPVSAIDTYLLNVWKESRRRCYIFDRGKIGKATRQRITVTSGQLDYEFSLLKSKVRNRDPSFYREVLEKASPEPNPIFSVREGSIESWERVINQES